MSTCGNRPLGTRLSALVCSLPGWLQSQLVREEPGTVEGCSLQCQPLHYSAAHGLLAEKVTKAHRPDNAKRLWPRDSSGDRVVGTTGHISQAVLFPLKKKNLTMPLLTCMTEIWK